MEAAVIYAREHGDPKVPFRVPAAVEDAEASGWPASLAGLPLGQWTADARRFYNRGDMDDERVAQLKTLGMVWSHADTAWAEGLASARGWAAEHGHLLAPLDAAFQGAQVGVWLKDARAAARKAQDIGQRRAAGLPVESSAGAMARARREQLEEIDPSWCPVWPVTWQRCIPLVPPAPGHRPGTAHHSGRGRAPSRRPRPVGHLRPARAGPTDRRAAVDVRADPRHRARDRGGEAEAPNEPGGEVGDAPRRGPSVPRVRGAPDGAPRKHIKTITISIGDGQAQRDVPMELGPWIDNQRRRAAALTPEQVKQLSKIGMRWAYPLLVRCLG